MLRFPEIDPVMFSLGPVELRWYGFMYLVGALAFWLLGRARARQAWRGVEPALVDDMVFYGVLGAVVGGRLGYMLFYDAASLAAQPLSVFMVWRGGMSFHGGLVGVLVAFWLLARRARVPLLRLLDFAAPMAPIGLGAGRVGNFINGELWGRATDAPWGMAFPHADALARHPSQLYEAAAEGVALFVLLWLFSAKPRPAGAVAGVFALGYAVARFGVEFFREPDPHLGFIAWDWLTMGQLLCLPVAAAGVALLVYARRVA